MGLRSSILGAVAALAVAFGSALVGAPPATAAARVGQAPDPAVVQGVTRLLRDSLFALSERSGPDDPQYFADGVWNSADPSCWYCQVGAGTAAAVLWRATGGRDPGLAALATATFDRAIADHRNADGSFGDPRDSPDIATMMFGVELGTSYVELGRTLGPARRRRWAAALAGGAEFLIRNGNLSWYTNGNINVGNVELFYLAWRATGEPRFRRAYDAAWRFALGPSQSRWPGFGLHRLSESVRSVGGVALHGPAGYLAESGGGRPGFDPEYTELQLDVTSRLYVLSHDPRALRLANLLVNAVLPRVNADWYLNTSGGTRHTQPNRYVPFLTPALAVLGWLGHRRDLAALLPAQFAEVDQVYRGALTYSSINMYRGLGNEVAVMLQAAMASAR